MTTTVIYNNFKAPQFLRNRFRRNEFEIWDANLHHGDVRPFACPEVACEDAGDIQTLYPLPDCKCFGFDTITDIVRGFCQDQHFYIQGGCLKQATESELCNNAPTCDAGAPFNPQAPSASSGCGGCDAVGVSYVITYVTEHAGIQVESAPSPASNIVASSGNRPGASVSWSAAPQGYCIVATRLYRAESTFEDGTENIPIVGSEFLFVAQFSGSGAGQFTDNVATDETDGPLSTYQPMAFPAPKQLVGVARTTDGVIVADKHRVYISRPGQPQFTFDGVVEVEDEIRSIRAIQNTIFVLTDNKPVKISYVHTDNFMSVDKQTVERRLPLTSLRSVSVYDDKMFFASTYGLYAWDLSGYGSDITLSLRSMISPEQWKNIDPDTVTGVGYEFGYMFSADGIDHSLMVEFGDDGTDNVVNQTSMMPITYINADAFALDYNGHIVYQQDGKVYCWDWRRCDCGKFEIDKHVIPPLCERRECCPWKIRMYFDNEGKNRFSKMRVEWDECSATHLEASFYLGRFCEESKMVGPLQVINSRGFSIPKFCSSQTFISEVQGCGILIEIRLAASNQELVSSSNNQLENRNG